MFGMVRRMMEMRKLRFEEGKISLFEQPILFCPSLVITELTHKFAETPNLYSVARRTGFEWFDAMTKGYKLKPQEIVEWGFNNMTMGGWGKFKVKEVQVLKKRSRTIIEESTIAKQYIEKHGKPGYPVDDFVRGLMAGGACVIHNHPTMEMIEKKCIGKGDRYCEIVALPHEDLDLSNPLIKKQIPKKSEELQFQV